MVVVHGGWPGPVCFHSQRSSKLQVLVGERQRWSVKSVSPQEGSLDEGLCSHLPPLGKASPSACVWRWVLQGAAGSSIESAQSLDTNIDVQQTPGDFRFRLMLRDIQTPLAPVYSTRLCQGNAQ